MSMSMSEFFFGTRCEICKNKGIICTQPGILNAIFTTVGPGQTEVWIDGQDEDTTTPALRYSSPISTCEIVTGKNSQEEVNKSMREQIKHLATHIPLSEHRPSNY